MLSAIPRRYAPFHPPKVGDRKGVADGQQCKVNTLATQEGSGASRINDLIGLFKCLETTTEEVPRRAWREHLSAAINLVVEPIELHPMGRNARGTKEDRFANVMFKNGASRRIEAGEC